MEALLLIAAMIVLAVLAYSSGADSRPGIDDEPHRSI
jgi:hypothetical protein